MNDYSTHFEQKNQLFGPNTSPPEMMTPSFFGWGGCVGDGTISKNILTKIFLDKFYIK